jgi:hypothetical protein
MKKSLKRLDMLPEVFNMLLAGGVAGFASVMGNILNFNIYKY